MDQMVNALARPAWLMFWAASLCALCAGCKSSPRQYAAAAGNRTFEVRGTVREVRLEDRTLIVAHEEVRNYMAAMTMPFRARHPEELSGLAPGDVIRFRLTVAESESWIDHIAKTGELAPVPDPPTRIISQADRHPLLTRAFTNELGQSVTLGQFKGQALAITFFFTRCPIPDYCPRLSRNFAEASRQLSTMPNAPTNWHMLSVSFDTSFDTPDVLKAYAELYHYDPAHWSFITGPEDQILQLARESNVTFEKDAGFFNHNFRTLIVDASGRLQTVFPIGGNLSEAIVQELVKAAAATNSATIQ
jgi:protein SCO1/2